MKILVNRTPKLGPWGGGAKTVNKLVSSLTDMGHTVVHRLESNIDVIFCIDPRPNEFGEWFQDYINYKSATGAKIIQRVGDVGTHGKPELTELVKACKSYSDYFIFPSIWAKDYINFSDKNYAVIDNAPMPVFHENKNTSLDVDDIPKLVTHHWSTNVKKGFDIYVKLEEHIKNTSEFEFQYIGRLPENVKLQNHVSPADAVTLSKILPKNDIYITASKEEAGANHVLEAMACGLPVIYHDQGGSINEYCHEYGSGYRTFDELLVSIRNTVSNYKQIKTRLLLYENVNSHVVERYIDIIGEVANEQKQN